MKKITAGLVACIPMSIIAVAASAEVHDVAVGPGGGFVFAPADIVLEVGDTVRWTWDSDGHNVGSGLPGRPTRAFLSGPPADAGTVFEVVFDQAFLDANPAPDDLYDYHCHPHGAFGMIGSIEVQPGCSADVTDDQQVDVQDLIAVIVNWGKGDVPGDANGDGVVDVLDLVAVIVGWGPCPR